MNTKSSFLRAIALAFLLSATSLHAALIFDNLNTPQGFGLVSAGGWKAQSFVVDGNNYSSVSVELVMGTSFDGIGNFFVRIEFVGSIETGSAIGVSSSADSGRSWDNPNPAQAFNMQVSAVPEPANMALGIFGLLLGGVQSLRWWNSRRSQSVPSL